MTDGNITLRTNRDHPMKHVICYNTVTVHAEAVSKRRWLSPDCCRLQGLPGTGGWASYE
jgi:hypothetical protein